MTKMEAVRGSDRIMAAWKNRALTDAAVREIAEGLSQTRGKIETVELGGGGTPTGMRVTISYAADDVAWCGNDMSFWLNWLRKHGGIVPERPKIIINGKPWPDVIRAEFDFGTIGRGGEQINPGEIADLGGLAGHVRG